MSINYQQDSWIGNICTLYTVHFTVYRVHGIQGSQYTGFTVYRVHGIQGSRYTGFTVYRVYTGLEIYCVLYNVHYKVHTEHCTRYVIKMLVLLTSREAE